MLSVFSSVAAIKRLMRHHVLGAWSWPGNSSWLGGTGAPFPGSVSSAAFMSSATVGLSGNSQGRPVGKTQGLEGNADDDSIGRALPSVDVGAEPRRHIPP